MAINNILNENTTGILVLKSAGANTGVTITNTANQIGVSNGDGTGGNPTISLTSPIYVSGISFDSGTTTLNLYSEGTWTPTLGSAGTAPTVTYTAQVGRYTSIGHQIMIQAYVAVNAYTAGTGNAFINTLPFNIANVTGQVFTASMNLQTTTLGAGFNWYQGFLQVNTNNVGMIGFKSATGGLQLTSPAFAASAIINFSGWYSTA